MKKMLIGEQEFSRSWILGDPMDKSLGMSCPCWHDHPLGLGVHNRNLAPNKNDEHHKPHQTQVINEWT